jgi:threonine dehydrogenase-like Zn-dependent dehydrogenase
MKPEWKRTEGPKLAAAVGVKVVTFMGTRPHVLHQAVQCCRNFGTVSLVGVYGFLDKIPTGSAINRGLTFRMALTPVQCCLPKLLERIEKGDIDSRR